jgi:hypothetical protein
VSIEGAQNIRPARAPAATGRMNSSPYRRAEVRPEKLCEEFSRDLDTSHHINAGGTPSDDRRHGQLLASFSHRFQ